MINTTTVLPAPLSIPLSAWLHKFTNKNSCKNCRVYIKESIETKTREITKKHLRENYYHTLYPNDNYCRRNYLDAEGSLRSCYFGFWDYEVERDRSIYEWVNKSPIFSNMPKAMPRTTGQTLRLRRFNSPMPSVPGIKERE